MNASGLVGDYLSPESTVTSLLSSSGNLRSSLWPPEHHTIFTYRDKEYDSASAALDAYIVDFERSRHNSESLTGKLVLPHNMLSTPSRPRVSMLRNKDVLRERLTESELDFLNLPISSLYHCRNHDRLSMTTDELLSIPCDGSEPVTHTSAFIQGLLSRSGASQPCTPSSRPAHGTSADPSSHTIPHHLSLHCSLPTRTPTSSRCRSEPGVAMSKPRVDISSFGSFKYAHRAARPQWAEPSWLLHFPHWFISNKADMDCCEISSVSDLKYPAWMQRCVPSEPPPPAESELWYNQAVLPPGPPRTGAPSWVADLDSEEDTDLILSQADSQQTLRDLRLQLAEQISLLTAQRQGCDIMATLFKDNRIESLIQKADQVLNKLSQNSGDAKGSVELVSSWGNTKELLQVSASLSPPLSVDSAGGEALTEKGEEAQSSGPHGNSSWKQPGPVEALKQMLFRLQAMETELQRQQTPAAPVLTEERQTPKKQWPDAEPELQGFPSLQRALHHLSQLKLLVEEHREEKDEDERRYSSSSADGLLWSQQEPL